MQNGIRLIAAGIVAVAFITLPAAGANLLGIVKIDQGGVGVPGVVEVTTNTGTNGSNTNVTVLGGGDQHNTGNLGGVLGNDGNVGLNLPKVGGLVAGLTGGDGSDGTDGTDGTDVPGVIDDGLGGGLRGNGGGIVWPNGSCPFSQQLCALVEIIHAKAWMGYASNNKLCLPAFGKTQVKEYVPQKDWDDLQAMLPSFVNDIALLQKLLGKCGSAIQKRALAPAGVGHVLTVGFTNDTPVVFIL